MLTECDGLSFFGCAAGAMVSRSILMGFKGNYGMDPVLDLVISSFLHTVRED